MRMSRKHKWIVTSIAASLFLTTILALPRFYRAFAYQEKISAPAIAKKLRLQLGSVSPHATEDSQLVDAHYSTFRLPANTFTHMQAHYTWLKLEGPSDAEVLLTEVGFPTELSADGNFTFYMDALNVQPATKWQVFTMTDREFESHLVLILGKAATPYADTRVGYFETSDTKGFIRCGSQTHYPDVINIAVWDNSSDLFQEITITMADPTLRQQVADSIAATYRFKVKELPSRDSLTSLARKAAATFNGEAG